MICLPGKLVATAPYVLGSVKHVFESPQHAPHRMSCVALSNRIVPVSILLRNMTQELHKDALCIACVTILVPV